MKAIAAGVILTAFSGSAVAPHAEPEMLLPGDEYVASELPADPKGNWFALLAREETYVLDEFTIVVESFHDPCIDDSPEQYSGRSVHVRSSDSVVLLVRGIDGLMPGTVKSAVVPVDHHDYDFDDLLVLGWSDQQLSLRAATDHGLSAGRATSIATASLTFSWTQPTNTVCTRRVSSFRARIRKVTTMKKPLH